MIYIAEIGVNHNGDLALAKKMIDEAKAAGADYVKFQTFSAEKLANKETPKVAYQMSTTDHKESHFEMLKKLELSHQAHKNLFDYCSLVNVGFLSTPYDIESARFLTELGVSSFKTASADLVDLPLHEYIASTKKPVLISVGMATIEEIDEVMQIYSACKSYDVTLLHCVSNYPCADASLNLFVLNSLKSKFNCKIGYSDHSVGSFAAAISAAFGVSVIEKHFTLDKNLPGPDHKASSTPEEFKDLVKAVEHAILILGCSEKTCQSEEFAMSQVSRKSITIDQNVKKGQVLEQVHFTLQRPGTGLKPKELKGLIGLKALRDLNTGYQPKREDFY